MNPVSKILHDHYRQTFLEHGTSTLGVDWGMDGSKARARQEIMLDVCRQTPTGQSILDVGCGYGALADVINEKQLSLVYTGVDVVEEMVDAARIRRPESTFLCVDFLNGERGIYDYVVCNGILTQKCTTTHMQMNTYAQSIIKRMYESCRIGVAFNLMSTYVNFQRDNLYYRNPAEMIAWCMSELTPHVRLNAAYSLVYEFTIYLYRPASGD